VTGKQQGEIYQADLKGEVHATQVELHSVMAVSGNAIPWTFKGEIQGNSISGAVHMGEYGEAKWEATRV
jgi:hypothetical protein